MLDLYISMFVIGKYQLIVSIVNRIYAIHICVFQVIGYQYNGSLPGGLDYLPISLVSSNPPVVSA